MSLPTIKGGFETTARTSLANSMSTGITRPDYSSINDSESTPNARTRNSFSNPFKINRPKGWTRGSYYVQIFVVFFMSILYTAVYTAMYPCVLLYMNYQGFTSSTDVSAYVTSTGLYALGPMIGNVVTSKVAKYYGHANALLLTSVLPVLGLLLVIFIQRNLFIFFVGYTLFSTSDCFRILPVSYLSKIVPPHDRTSAVAINSFMIFIGGIIGPFVWLAAQTFRSDIQVMGMLRINRFTINFSAMITILVIMGTVYKLFLDDEKVDSVEMSQNRQSQFVDLTNVGPAEISLPDGTVKVVDLKWYRIKIFSVLSLFLALVNFSTGVYMSSLQPVLVNKFQRTDAEIGDIMVIIGVVALVPPLILSFLSRLLDDRQIIALGLLIKAAGILCFLGPDISEWRVVLGFILIIKATVFFVSTSISLSTKLVGPLLVPDLIGYSMSSFTFGPFIGLVSVAPIMMTCFEHQSFALFALPFLIACGIALQPRVWELADNHSPFVTAVLAESERVKREQFLGV